MRSNLSGAAKGGERRTNAPIRDAWRRKIQSRARLHLHVNRQRQEHRSGWRRQGSLDSAAHGRRNVLDALNLRRPFRPRTGHPRPDRRTTQAPRSGAGDLAGRPSAKPDCRNNRRCRACPSHCPSRNKYGRWPRRRARGHRVTVRHGHHRDFVKPEDVVEPRIVDEGVVERQLGRAGIAEDVLDPRGGEESPRTLQFRS